MPVAVSPQEVLRDYFHAKDENRPHLLDRVFGAHAVLTVLNNASTIAFPARTVGREAISGVLVRDFCRTYENIYSFYLDRPPADCATFSCDWLVAMSEKTTGSARVGCGAYEWRFDPGTGGLASRLAIAIEAMQVLPAETFPAILRWIGTLGYPWCDAAAAIAAMPAIDGLAPVRSRLAAVGRTVKRLAP